MTTEGGACCSPCKAAYRWGITVMQKNALIVEDDKDTAAALGRVMQALNFSVELASTLEGARKRMESQPPDLVLLDLSLPDGNGLEFMLEMRDKHPSRFVVITGDTSQQAAIESLRAEADDFLVKPVSLSQLRTTISRSVAKQEEQPQKDATTEVAINELDEKAIVDALVGKTFWHLEKDLLLATLERLDGDKEAAARTLGISLKTLYNRLHAYS